MTSGTVNVNSGSITTGRIGGEEYVLQSLPPARADGDLNVCMWLQAFRYSAEKANDASDGGLTPQLQTRMPAGAQNGPMGSQQQQAGAVNGFNEQYQQQQQQQHAGGGPLQPFNGQQGSAAWKAPWQQDVAKPVQHRCETPPPPCPRPCLSTYHTCLQPAGRRAHRLSPYGDSPDSVGIYFCG